MIYKIKIKDKESGEIDYVIMGDSYKEFREHFTDIISHWTEKWHYASEEKYAECFGRTINKEVLEIWKADSNFVSFGGLKMCHEKIYNQKVKEHNENGNYDGCEWLENLHFIKQHDNFTKALLKEKRVITEDELKDFAISGVEE